MSRMINELGHRRFERYPDYAESGVEWLGQSPAHWRLTKMWNVAQPMSGGTPTRDTLRYWDGGIPWVSPKDMKRRYIDSSEDTVTAAALVETGLKLVPAPVVLVVVRGMILAHSFPVGITTVPVTINQDMKALHLAEALDPEFFGYWLAGVGPDLLPLIVDEAAHGTKAIRMDRWRVTPVQVPPRSEQRAIVDFLRRRTGRIDALISKNERLLERLGERRSAIITHTVTRGLRPNSPMKDSGEEWLGAIPKHWEARRWRFCCRITQGQVDPGDVRYSDRVLIGPNHVESGTGKILFLETSAAQESISGKYLVRKGDLIYSKIRPALNKACIAEGEWLCSADMYPVAVMGSILRPRFLLYFVLSDPFVRRMVDESMRVAMPKVNRDTLADCLLLLPPVAEQDAIIALLDTETARLDALSSTVAKVIDRLKELRAALISAAVTGKIDVRDEVA